MEGDTTESLRYLDQDKKPELEELTRSLRVSSQGGGECLPQKGV